MPFSHDSCEMGTSGRRGSRSPRAPRRVVHGLLTGPRIARREAAAPHGDGVSARSFAPLSKELLMRRFSVLTIIASLTACSAASDEPPETAPAEAAAALSCSSDEIESGQKVCAGAFSYSLACYARARTAACGVEQGPVACTTYATCAHPDFGTTRGTYAETVVLASENDTCDDAAQAHLATLSPADRAGVTYTYTIGGGGEQSLQKGSGAPSLAAAGSGIQSTTCHITYQNHPVDATGTGPQCGTVTAPCAPACVNYATCRHPDFGVDHVVGRITVYNWGTGAQCGTMIGPCSSTSAGPLLRECRDASHGSAPEADCGAGFDGAAQGAVGAPLAQVQAQAAAQWLAAGNAGAPVYDAPFTCTDCRHPLQISQTEVLGRVYAAAGMAKKDARLHVLAGAAYHLGHDNPALTAAQISAGITTIASALDSYSVPAAQDGSGHMVNRMVRMIAKAEPSLASSTPAGAALRAYARELLASMRTGLDQERRLASIPRQADRYAEAEVFIAAAWRKLREEAAVSPALAGAIDGGVIGTTLGVLTTQSATQVLAVYPVEPLKTFILAHLEADGSISSTAADLRALVDTASTRGVSVASAYAANLFELNAAEQAYRDARAFAQSSAEPAAMAAEQVTLDQLKAAIQKAEARNQELKSTLKDAKEGVTGAMDLAAELAKRSNDPSFAKDIETFSKALETAIDGIQKYSESAVKAASKVAGILDLGAVGLNIVSGAIFTGEMVGVVIKILSLFNKGPQQPPTEQVILAKVNALKDLVVDVRDEMRGRFDRIDRNLNLVYGEMTRQFGLVNWSLGTVNGNVTELQEALFSFQGDLNRLDRHIYAFLDAIARRPFIDTVSGALGWREKVLDPSFPMPFSPNYLDAENDFYVWSNFYARDSLSAGPEQRADSDDALLTELTDYPLAFNINYLRTLPSTKLGLPSLANDRLRNPLDWMVGAEAYSQLAEEWPAHAALVSSSHRDALATAGAALQAGLAQIEQPALFQGLAAHYRARWADLKTQINQAEQAFEASPARNLFGVDLWSGPDQRPTQHYLSASRDLPRCSGGVFNPGVDRLPLAMNRWSHDELVPFMVAGNRGLGTLDACIDGHWTWYSSASTPWGTSWTFRLYADVNVRFNGTTIYTHRFNSTIERTHFVWNIDPPFNPDTFWSPYPLLADNWSSITAPDSTKTFSGQAARNTVRAAVSADLTDLQSDFYDEVAARMTQAGDGLSLAANRLSGSKLMWESYVAMGLPLSLENNEALREALYGSEAVLTGRDLGSDDDVVDDVQDAYRFFALHPSSTNPITAIDASVLSRANRLESTISSILTRLTQSGDTESTTLVAPTLLRLRLLAP
ncbi:hypothetical protein A7982_13738 [Minicystis rosea]|nr:hypothetical protein A7982_13738 [Minicystis rosea]